VAKPDWKGEKRMAKRNTAFVKISGIKKIGTCKSCGKRMEIKNFNQMLCEKCGYRESSESSKSGETTA
jgi:Zn finger protein HypA/HybF involved in hydrogenase expression